MKRRWKILIGLAVVIFAIVAVWQISLRLRVEMYKKELLAKGEKLEIAQLLPPPFIENQNGAALVKRADTLLPSLRDNSMDLPMMRLVAPGKAIACFQQPDIRYRYSTNSWSNIVTAVASNRQGTVLLRQGLKFRTLDFHPNYYSGSYGLPEKTEQGIAETEHCTRALLAEAICDLRNNNAAEAVSNVCSVLAFVNGEDDEWLIDAQWTRRLIASSAVNASWELLQSSNVNDAELAALQKGWERLEFIHAMESAISMERARAEGSIQKMRASSKYLNSLAGTAWNFSGFSGNLNNDLNMLQMSFQGSIGRPMWRAWWTYSDELRMLQNYQLILVAIRTIETNGCFDPACSNLAARLQDLQGSQSSGLTSEFRWMFSGISEAVGLYSLQRTTATEAARRMVVAAIALKRYQLKNGNYPPDLNALVPEFVATVPLDPVDGKPLRYRLKPGGTFLLYSIGINGVDDGGNGARIDNTFFGDYWLDPHSLDWVWPQPATPEEIQKFYAQRKD